MTLIGIVQAGVLGDQRQRGALRYNLHFNRRSQHQLNTAANRTSWSRHTPKQVRTARREDHGKADGGGREDTKGSTGIPGATPQSPHGLLEGETQERQERGKGGQEVRQKP
jgi:hypothetical protein